MLVRRYSGRVKVVLQFCDKEDAYECELYVAGENVGDVYVGLPDAWTTLPEYRDGVDSDEAFDSAARAALIFAMHDDDDEDGPLIDAGDVEWTPDLDAVAISRKQSHRAAPTLQQSLDFGRHQG